MESKVSNQMHSYYLTSWMALFALILVLFSSYLLVGFGFLSITYTSMIVIFFSTFLYIILSNHKTVLHVDKLVEEEEENFLISEKEENISDQCEKVASIDPFHKLETSTTEAKEELVTIDSQDFLSESESQDHLSTSEGSEVDWSSRFRYDDIDHNSFDYSDGSISDEESLIEIALPSGHYVDMQKNEPKKKELSTEKLFSQQSLMELLSEFNEVSEEENFIEIDLSMGSIKYSRFEIKA